jgi:hypothetical protein
MLEVLVCVEPQLADAFEQLAEAISTHAFRHYLPFLTMSCTAKNPADMFGNC